jgi:Peptidase MA superfamily
MFRWLRLVFALFAALLVSAASSAAYARPAEIGAAPPGADVSHGPPLVVPHDVPVLLPTAHAAIPPVPPSYVTKDLGWLELSYPPSAGERVQSILQDADAIKAELSRSLGQPVLSRVTVRVAPTVADMARLAPADAPPPEYASGVAYHGLHLVLLSLLQPRGAEAVDLDEVFRHELAHVALEDAVQGKHVPVWFNEGLAISLSGELAMARTKTLWSATLSGTLIPLSDLDRSFPRDNFDVSIAYAESADFMRFLTRKSDRLRFSAMIGRVREGQAFDRAMTEAYGSDLRRLELEWRSDLEHRFSVIPVLTGGGLVWVLVLGALVAAYVRRRRRSKAILARWEREEAIEDARIAARLAAERAAASGPFTPVSAPIASVVTNVSLKIERDGGWHTIH